MRKDIAVKVEHVSKSFKLPHEKQDSLKGALINIFNTRSANGYEQQQVLKDISFEVQQGEFFGIVGRNGSGKSTLLKLLAGIYSPDGGTISTNGRIVPFIELGVGFNPELTGRENVYLNGALLGFDRKEIAVMYDDIVAFAELEKFMDQKLKNYSSGMQVRLAFSIAIQAEGDVLILDEVLAVGDEAFQKKCIEVFERYKQTSKTIILVTHDMSVVERFCDRAIMIEEGRITESGNPRTVAARYSNLNLAASTATRSVKKDRAPKHLEDLRLELFDEAGHQTNQFKEGSTMTIRMSWKHEGAKHAGIAISRTSGEVIYGPNTFTDGWDGLKGKSVKYTVNLNLAPGKYYLQAATFGRTDADVIARMNDGLVLGVQKDDSKSRYVGITRLDHSWSVDV